MTAIRWLMLFLLLCACVPAAYAVRCDSNLTHTGDYEFQVRARCGEPLWAEDHYRIESFGNKDTRIEREIRYTDWYYNFGASALIVHLRFRDGQLAGEEKLGRGVDEVGTACDAAILARGLSSGELIAHCGEPAARETYPGSITRRVAHHVYVQDEDDREDWVYDLGGDLLYVVRLVNGRVNYLERRKR